MPELYGNPFKSELYAENRRLKSEVLELRKKSVRNTIDLRYAYARIEALEAKIERMGQIADQLRTEAAQEVKIDLRQVMRRRLQAIG